MKDGLMTKTFGPTEPPFAALRSANRDDAYKGAASATPHPPQFCSIGDPMRLWIQWIFIAAVSL